MKPDAQLSGGAGEGKRSSEVSVSVQVTGAASGRQKSGLSVEADSSGDTTLITLKASGSSPVHWSARTGASWLYMSQSSGTLRPGESLTIKVYVDHLREPNGPWNARVSIAPADAVVFIGGYGTAGPSHPAPAPDATPSAPTPSAPGSTPSDPTPSAPEPTPTGPPPSEPDPTPTEPTDPPSPPSDGSTPAPSGN
ncbi:hypothetical protein GCM10010094_91010 [Streptomyces flaveus]|uniref:BACON domain-containing protein n=1 Tax=Streptomyces flaveus TaxID=66370 RepID=A0A917VTE4_9ACTN|nr:hypothetical protein GCM10010094_91010 [Streptomyces flaveus]